MFHEYASRFFYFSEENVCGAYLEGGTQAMRPEYHEDPYQEPYQVDPFDLCHQKHSSKSDY